MNPSERIDQLIESIADWRGKTLADVRQAMLDADKDIVEEWKWMGSPTWYRDGIIAVADAHKDKVKITFSHGAKLADPDKLFNAGLGGGTRRAIDLFEGDKVNARTEGAGTLSHCAQPGKAEKESGSESDAGWCGGQGFACEKSVWHCAEARSENSHVKARGKQARLIGNAGRGVPDASSRWTSTFPCAWAGFVADRRAE